MLLKKLLDNTGFLLYTVGIVKPVPDSLDKKSVKKMPPFAENKDGIFFPFF
jgi:hypothetical protein